MLQTSPTLTLKIRAPEALTAFKALRAEADLLTLSLAKLGAAGGAGGRSVAFTRMSAEVKELRAALQAAQMQMGTLAAAAATKSEKTVAGLAKETAAVKTKAQATKAAALSEEAAAVKTAAVRQKIETQIVVGQQRQEAEEFRNLRRKHTAALAAESQFVQRRQQLQAQELTAMNALQMDAARKRAAATRAVETSFVVASERQAAEAYAARLKAETAATALAAAERNRIRASEAAAAAVQHRAAMADRLRTEKIVAAQQGALAAQAQRSETGTNRSIARGAAGAAGGLWLTYGQNIPALAGAFGAASTVQQSVKQGSEFQYQTAFAGALGGQTPEQLERTRSELKKMGTDSIYGPLELAKGLRVLEQAGVGANDALQILPISMKVALQGETDLTAASESLVGIMRQFQLTVKDIPAIGDAISKTASVTQANIPSLMEALKAATGLANYGVDLNQTLANIGMLAKQGITGSSGGTFFRRFVEDIYMPKSDGARRTMKELNLTPYTKDGQRRDFREVQEELVTKLQGYKPESQIRMLGELMDIRGLKHANTLVSDMAREFMRLRGEIDNSKGALDLFWKAMSGESKLMWEQVKSNFSGAVIEAFTVIEDPLKSLLGQMRDFFKSDEVKLFLKTLMMIPAGYGHIKDMVKESNKDGARPELPGAMGLPQVVLETIYTRLKNRKDAVADAKSLRDAAPRRFAADPNSGDALTAGAAGFGAGPALPPKKDASGRILDPEAFRQARALSAESERESVAAMARETRRIEQQADHELAIAEEKNRGKLISEQAYEAEVARIQQVRRDREIAVAGQEIENLKKAARGDKEPAERAANARKQRDIAAKRDELVNAAKNQEELRKIKKEVSLKTLQDESADLFSSVRLEERQRREALGLENDMRLAPGPQAARMRAEFDARKRFEKDIEEVDKKISKGATGDTLRELQARKAGLEDLRDTLVGLRGDEAQLRAEQERTFGYGAREMFLQFEQAATDSAQHARDVFGAGFNALTQDLMNFAKTGKLSFRGFATAVVNEMLRIQAAKAAAGIFKVLERVLPTALGGKGGTPSIGGAVGDFPAIGDVMTAHSGAIVGREYDTRRMVDARAFSNAPRFHTGGIIGNEVPVIAQRGEGVFTPEQMSAMAPVGGGRGDMNVEVTVNVETGAATTDTKGGNADEARQLGKLMSAAALQVIVDQQRPGGLLERKRN